jgi:high-affinity Fe2+/Pb2+ permease
MVDMKLWIELGVLAAAVVLVLVAVWWMDRRRQ